MLVAATAILTACAPSASPGPVASAARLSEDDEAGHDSARPTAVVATADQVRAGGTVGTATDDARARARREGCPRLRPPLLDLAYAADPVAVATARRVEHDRARARITLRTSRDDAELRKLYDVHVLSRTAVGWLTLDDVQASVPFQQLCPLASDWRVSRLDAIRLPMPN